MTIKFQSEKIRTESLKTKIAGFCGVAKFTENLVTRSLLTANSETLGETPMDQITMKTPNPKCRFYWCLIDFIDWRYSQSCWYFRPLLWGGGEGGDRVVLLVNLKKSRHLRFGVFIDIWSMLLTKDVEGDDIDEKQDVS
jgi:hypothetical protein